MESADGRPTINEVVAYNLGMARRLRGLTQEDAVLLVNRHMSDSWSANTLSVAETSGGGKRVRHFTVEQVVAFALAFDVPIVYFLLPIEEQEDTRIEMRTALRPENLGQILDTRHPAVVDRLTRLGRWTFEAKRDAKRKAWKMFVGRLLTRRPAPEPVVINEDAVAKVVRKIFNERFDDLAGYMERLVPGVTPSWASPDFPIDDDDKHTADDS